MEEQARTTAPEETMTSLYSLHQLPNQAVIKCLIIKGGKLYRGDQYISTGSTEVRQPV